MFHFITNALAMLIFIVLSYYMDFDFEPMAIVYLALQIGIMQDRQINSHLTKKGS